MSPGMYELVTAALMFASACVALKALHLALRGPDERYATPADVAGLRRDDEADRRVVDALGTELRNRVAQLEQSLAHTPPAPARPPALSTLLPPDTVPDSAPPVAYEAVPESEPGRNYTNIGLAPQGPGGVAPPAGPGTTLASNGVRT